MSERTPLRVLFVDSSIGFGGATKGLSLVLRALPEVEALILTSQPDEIVQTWYRSGRVLRFRRVFNYRNREKLEAWAQIQFQGVWPRRLLLAFYDLLDRVVALIGCARIVWLVRRNRCDLIHLNNSFMPPEAIIAARITHVPFVVHLREFWSRRAGVESRLARLSSRVIAVSRSVATHLPTDVIPGDRVVSIHDPVDCEAFESARRERDSIRRAWRIPPEAVAFGIFGRVVPWKGQAEFIQAVLRVMEHCSTVWGVVVGDESDGEREYFTRLQQVIQSSGHASRFVFAGYQRNVERWYWSVDVVVHASIEPEPFGMVVPEGMCACRPVIAAGAGGPTEVITNGVDGLLVPPGDVDAMAEAIRRLAADADLRERMGEAGHSKVRRLLNVPVVAAQVRAVYDAVLGTNGGVVPGTPGNWQGEN